MSFLLLNLIIVWCINSTTAFFTEPYPPLSNGVFTNNTNPNSLDPLVSYVWDASFPGDTQQLQVFSQPPIYAAAYPSASAHNLSSLINSTFNSSFASLDASQGPVEVIISFATEHACWLEIIVPGGVPTDGMLVAAISEYNSLRPDGYHSLIQRGSIVGELRLETNAELFDGLRYAFLKYTCKKHSCATLPLAGIRRTCQVLPLDYTGSFKSNDDELNRIWYTGAFSVRVNALPGFLGSELLDRGDRAPPFQGDAHVSNIVGLTAFASPRLYSLAKAMINLTDSAQRSVHDSNIATYPLMWVITVCDYYQMTGDAEFIIQYAPSIESILENSTANFFGPNPVDLRWSGADDRLGSGYNDVNQTPEARRFYWMTTIRAVSAFADAAGSVPALAAAAASASNTRSNLVALVRKGGATWWKNYGIHSLAAAVLGGWTSSTEKTGYAQVFNDSARICSLSNYDSGFLLEAVGVVLGIDYATAMLRLCWGRQLNSGATCWWEATLFYDSMLSNSTARDVDIIPGAKTSGCHAWGSYPTSWMTRNHLGIKPLSPSFVTFKWAPAISVLSHIEGSIATPSGIISANADVSARAEMIFVVDLSLSYPASLSPALFLPEHLESGGDSRCGSLRLVSVIMGGREVGLLGAVGDDGLISVEFNLIAGELFNATARYERQVCKRHDASANSTINDTYPYAPFAPPLYPLTLSIDNATRGYWRDFNYGSDGFILFGYSDGPDGPHDFSSLPYYATIKCSSTRILDRSGTSVASLQDPTDKLKPRRLGSVITTGGGSGLYGLFVDVVLASVVPVKISVYVAANTTQVVHIEDLTLRNVLAPDLTLRAYTTQPKWGGNESSFNAGGLWALEEGLYVSFVANQSVRVRVYCVEGCYSSVSALFFDPEKKAVAL